MNIIPDSVPNALTSPGFFTLLEPTRMIGEMSALALASPLLLRNRTTDGRPILIVTGALSTNIGTNEMRTVLKLMGHKPHTPPETTMFRTSKGILEIVVRETEKLYEQYQEPITLAGWCIGGAFTRMAAHAIPDKIRQVVNMGASRTGKWYPKEWEHAGEPLPVPSTVVYSRTDGTMDWRKVCDPAGPRSENIEVISSHWGMANHPHTVHIIADRLSQPLGEWTPYRGLTGHGKTTAETTSPIRSVA